MITGTVRGRHALVQVAIQINGQPDLGIEFVLDTGFAGFLTLPVDAVSALNLPFDRFLAAHLADGSRVITSVYLATIVWDDVATEVEVLATGREPLLGTSLLHDKRVCIDFVEGGAVTIQSRKSTGSPDSEAGPG